MQSIAINIELILIPMRNIYNSKTSFPKIVTRITQGDTLTPKGKVFSPQAFYLPKK
ncbi:hypothetical protein PEDI_45920 [Persicobacter diffluens]|uniref:Uncharacterized protein n=1 Tax=Persicobacter diffluens TaxID=981 RepID=A0AAN4W4Q1_9BACT|nr:hypothetical protein PEDI_45920 [Persicobacter diffluens]